jgi:homoserine kinase
MKHLIKVPATSANLGTGFDTLGLCLDLWNEARVEFLPGAGPVSVEIDGEGSGELPSDDRHLIVQVAENTCRSYGVAFPRVSCHFLNRIPLARGMGSSAAARCAGVAIGLLAAGASYDPMVVATEASRLEGHPDNVVPAVHGGLTASLAIDAAPPLTCSYRVHPDWRLVLAIPEFHLETERSRKALPPSVSFSDACHNLARIPFLLDSLVQGKPERLAPAIQDVLHQPYRVDLVPGIRDVFAAATRAGAAGVYLSGAGPTVAAWVWSDLSAAENVGTSMVQAFHQSGISARSLQVNVSYTGIQIQSMR